MKKPVPLAVGWSGEMGLFEPDCGSVRRRRRPPLGQLDEVELNFIAVNHNFIVREIRGIATGD